jgi:hypothetical protein
VCWQIRAPTTTARMAGDEPSRTARVHPTRACALRLVRSLEPQASFPTCTAVAFVRKRCPPLWLHDCCWHSAATLHTPEYRDIRHWELSRRCPEQACTIRFAASSCRVDLPAASVPLGLRSTRTAMPPAENTYSEYSQRKFEVPYPTEAGVYRPPIFYLPRRHTRRRPLHGV